MLMIFFCFVSLAFLEKKKRHCCILVFVFTGLLLKMKLHDFDAESETDVSKMLL